MVCVALVVALCMDYFPYTAPFCCLADGREGGGPAPEKGPRPASRRRQKNNEEERNT